jgi:hypothetical protein
MSARLAAILLSSAALFATSPAFAIEPEDAADALAAALTGTGGGESDYAEASLEGSNVVIKGLSLSHGSETDKESITFEQTVIEIPAEGDTGVFGSPRVTFTNGAIAGESTGTIANATLTDVIVLDPAEVEGGGPAQTVLFHTAEATGLKMTRSDEPGEVTVARVYVETANMVDNIPQDSKGMVEDISLPPEVFAGAEFSPQTIGYDKLVLDLSWDGSRDAATQTMTVRDLTLGIQDGGALKITGVLGKIPAPNTLNDPDAAAKAAEIEVHTVTVRYDDQSLAGRVLDMLAKQQGLTRDDYAKQIAGALPFLLAALNNQEFQNQVAGALGTFLQDPKSLTIKLEPSAPVTGGEIMGLVGTAPQTLPDRLNASVTANN